MPPNTAGQSRWSVVSVLGLCLLMARLASADGLAISYCSPDNTAGSYPSVYAEFQSTGLCGDHCQGSYAFAVIQGYYCWCSNYIPADQDNTLSCNQGCPGINTEWCGNTASGLYAYFLLSSGQPLGTAGSGSSSSSSNSASSVSTILSSSGSSSQTLSTAQSPSHARSSSTPLVTLDPPQSSVQTTSSTPVSVTSSSSSASAALSSSTTTPSTTPNSSASLTSSSPAPVTTPRPTEIYTSVTTVTGQVRTVIVTPSATADATLGQASTSGNAGVSAGKVAGIVIGVAVGLGLIVGGSVWWWLRRRNHADARGTSPEGSFSPQRTDGSSGTTPSRQVSQMSQSGLLGKRPRIMTAGLAAGSDPRSADSSNMDRRSLGTDQRLNPYALYSHDEAQVSSVSLQDNQDYSRQLRVANPDP